MVLEITKGEKKYGEQIIFRDFSCKLDFMKWGKRALCESCPLLKAWIGASFPLS